MAPSGKYLTVAFAALAFTSACAFGKDVESVAPDGRIDVRAMHECLLKLLGGGDVPHRMNLELTFKKGEST